MSAGVKVVGAEEAGTQVESGLEMAPVAEGVGPEIGGAGPREVGPAPRVSPRGGRTPEGRRRPVAVAALAVVAVLGLAGTLTFGLAWAGQHARLAGESQAKATASKLVVDLTNFNAKTVDADFSAITAMATGTFAKQANQFFNSSIRRELQDALASSRGQVRSMYVQSYGTGKASVYAVVDQLYANNKISSPQSDVLRLVVDMGQVGSIWKVTDVTVLTGPSPTGAAAGSKGAGASGSGSTSATSTTSGSTTPSTAGG